MMLSDNIKKYRKANNMSQDELAQKLDVTRQSVSLWENGQSQPTIDNIIALTKIFGISSDELLDTESCLKETEAAKGTGAAVNDADNIREKTTDSSIFPAEDPAAENKHAKKMPAAAIAVAAVVVIVIVLAVILLVNKTHKAQETDTMAASAYNETGQNLSSGEEEGSSQVENAAENPSDSETEKGSTALQDDTAVNGVAADASADSDVAVTAGTEEDASMSSDPEAAGPSAEASADEKNTAVISGNETQTEPVQTQTEECFDLFEYCKNFAIETGTLNGDYCMYQQPSTLYGGYDGEYFSVSYWGDSNMVEFCLHCPLSDTQSINFYLRMRGGYDGKYEYLTSKYYRSDGTSIRSASGYIDPAVFSDQYPLSCDSYIGSADGQTEFMEESRVGICDLIHCLKQFVTVENMDCDFIDFDFAKF